MLRRVRISKPFLHTVSYIILPSGPSEMEVKEEDISNLIEYAMKHLPTATNPGQRDGKRLRRNDSEVALIWLRFTQVKLRLLLHSVQVSRRAARLTAFPPLTDKATNS